jgi:3-oxoacyl-[acyl-carrier-protein] synthase III
MQRRIGVLGVGLNLPPTVRRNDWWSAAIVDEWVAKRRAALPAPPPTSPTEQRIYAALAAQAADPFQLAVERHVISPGQTHTDMEEAAARVALERAEVGVEQIDLLLTHQIVPEYWLSNPACELHERLGLPRRCFSMHVDAAAYSFMQQLALAETMISAGRAHRALIVQSSASSRTIDLDDPNAPIFGDGATATVVGPVADDRGILSAVHFTDGRFPKTLIASVPGKRWFDDGAALIHVADQVQMRNVFMLTVDCCVTSVAQALVEARQSPDAVDFLAMYQGTPWIRELVQERTGTTRARSVETFAYTGYLASGLVPASLFLAEEQGQLQPGNLVVLTGGGTGMTYGAIAMRWGR